MRRSQLVTALAVTAVLSTGCSGPAAPLDVGTQKIPLALALGELKARDQAPIGPLSDSPSPASAPYYQPPVGQPLPIVSASGSPRIPVVPCPDFDPLAPVLGVGRVISSPPVPGSYPYRAELTQLYAGKPSGYVGNSTWDIKTSAIDATTGGYDVTYTVHLGSATTTRVLRILPHDISATDGSDPTDQTNPNEVLATANSYLTSLGAPTVPTSAPNLSAYGLAGIYLVSQTANGSTFEPTVPIALLQLRQLTGARDAATQNASAITSVGSDPRTNAVMAFRSTVTTPANTLNACGTKLQSVQVTLTSPNSPDTAAPANPATDLTGPDFGAAVYAEKAPGSDVTKPKSNVLLFKEKIDIGLQFGGLVLADSVAVVPKGLLPPGLVLDPADPPLGTPSGPPPSPDPGDPAGTATATALWAGSPLIVYAIKHGITKTDTFTINVKPKLPKDS